MNVLSLFDGISCGQVALERAGIKPTIYYASEIEKSAMRITMRNYPNTMQLGDVRHVRKLAEANVFGQGGVDMLIGGSPCQGFSQVGKQRGFDDPRSQLLFDYVAIKQKLNPRWFLLENVRMAEPDMAIVTALLGVTPVLINSSLLSAQSRPRVYWTNIPIAPITDAKAMFWAIREYADDAVRDYACNRTPSRERMWANGKGTGNKGTCANITVANKAACLTTKQDRHNNAGLIAYRDFCRYLTVKECERLQTLPDDYTRGESRAACYRALGNGWTVDVIAHIMRGVHA